MKTSLLGSLLLIAALLLSSCTVVLPAAEKLIEPGTPVAAPGATPGAEAQPTPDLAATLAMANEQLGALSTAMIQAGLLDILLTGGPYTILAPTDEAFAALDNATVAALTADQERLAAVLRFHVIAGALPLADLEAMETVENLEGVPLEIVADEQGLRISEARILVSDIVVPNGIVHVVDAILYPLQETQVVDLIRGEESLGTLVTLLELTNLEEQLRQAEPFTILAPTDEAFAAFFAQHPALMDDVEGLTALLKRHIIATPVLLDVAQESVTHETWSRAPVTVAFKDLGFTVEGATVLLANLEAADGAIHVIDQVLAIPENAAPEIAPELMALVQQRGDLGILTQVFGLEMLQEQLAGLEAFTLFVPTEEAFRALSDETIEQLVADRELQTYVLRNHIVPQALLAADLATLTETLTLAGEPLRLQADPLAVNEAALAATDIQVSGGVVHIVEAVLLPPPADAPPAEQAEATPPPVAPPAIASRQMSLVAMLRAIVDSGLLDELELIGPFTIFGPSDVALAALPAELLTAIFRDPQALRALLELHIVPGALSAGELVPGVLQSLAGLDLTVAVDPASGMLTVNGANIVWMDMRIGDVVIHIVDRVLLPDEAWQPPVEEEVAQEQPDQAPAEEEEPEPLAEEGNTLRHALRREGRLELFASLFEIADLDQKLAEEGPLTLIAPTDDALGVLPNYVLLDIIRQPDLLANLLNHHVISGSLQVENLAQLDSVTTHANRRLAVSVEAGVALFGNARVIDVIQVDNGTLYVIDTLVMHPDMALCVVGKLYALGEYTEFIRLLELAGLAEGLSGEEQVTLLAPTDQAFAELTEEHMAFLTADVDALATWLGRYILPRRVTSAELTQLRSIESTSGDILAVRARRGNLILGGTRVIERDIQAANGLIHSVDTVVLPRP